MKVTDPKPQVQGQIQSSTGGKQTGPKGGSTDDLNVLASNVLSSVQSVAALAAYMQGTLTAIAAKYDLAIGGIDREWDNAIIRLKSEKETLVGMLDKRKDDDIIKIDDEKKKVIEAINQARLDALKAIAIAQGTYSTKPNDGARMGYGNPNNSSGGG